MSLNKTSFIVLCFSLLAGFTSCSEDEKETPVIFPEKQELTCNAGDVETFSFSATHAWTLTSSQMWCKFVKDKKEVLDMTGGAGLQHISITVNDEGQTNEKMDRADITLHCGDKEAVIATVIRSAKGYDLKVFDAEGNEVKDLVVGYNDYTTFSIQANFRFAVTWQPAWAQLKDNYLVGVAGEVTKGGIRFAKDGESEKYEQTGKMLISDEQGKASFSIDLIFQGMPRNEISITRPDGGTAWNWLVSADGKTFTQNGNTYSGALSFGLAAYHNDVEVVMMETFEDKEPVIGQIQWAQWNVSQQRLTISANDKHVSRKLYVLAFPRQTYNEIKGDLKSALIGPDGELSGEISQRNLVISLTQAEKEEDGLATGTEMGFYVESFAEYPNGDQEMVKVECYNIIDEAFLAHCEEVIGTRKVFLLSQPSCRENGNYDVVTPYPYLQYFDDWGDNRAYFARYDGSVIEDDYPITNYDDTATPTHWQVCGVTESRKEKDGYFLVMLNPDREKTVMKALFVKTKK